MSKVDVRIPSRQRGLSYHARGATELQPPVPGVDGPVPVVAFEIESSWRTRKHVKGTY